MLSVLSGLATFIGLNLACMIAYYLACANSQLLLLILRFSPLAWPIRLLAWSGCAWAGLTVWDALA
jgi:hypothetical protein